VPDAISQFCEAIERAGLPAPKAVQADGALHRFSTNGKPNDTSGWYVLYLDGVPAGCFGCWRSGISEKWRADIGRKMTDAEKRHYRRIMNTIRRQRKEEKTQRQSEAAVRAAEIWAKAQPVAEHPYLSAKGVDAHGLRCAGDALIVPMYDGQGQLHSLQSISGDGSKRFLSGGQVSGCYYSIGTINDVLCICEGFATGASIHEVTGHAVAVAFNAGNLLAAADAMRENYPDVRLIICADDDVDTDGNPGMTKAKEAAAAVGADVVVPDFGDDRPEGATDFNDLHRLRGLDIVRRAFEAPVTVEQKLNDDVVIELSKLDPIKYGQRRKQVAKQLGVPVTAVDQSVKQVRHARAESSLLFPEIEPCLKPVSGDELLMTIAAEIRRYIVLPEHAVTAATLWVMHTYAVDAAYIAPILAVQSPQKRCGKSQLLTVLNALVYRGLMVANLSLAALYRAMDQYRPTLLIDEADSFLDQNEEMRGIINSGHSRATARTLRVGGENHNELEIFDSFGPKAIAGIGKRRDTIADRSIVISLRRRTKDEQVSVLRQDRLDYSDLRSQCAGWAAQNLDALKAADPAMSAVLHDRAQDNWRPLLAIADLCGWGTQARAAAMALTESDGDESAAAMVLEDIHTLFRERGANRFASADIVDALAKMEERPWPEWRQGKPITQRQLARLLAPFGIKPKLIKFSSDSARGYKFDQFADSFTRYISDVDPLLRYQSSNDRASSDSESVTEPITVTDRSVTVTEKVTDEFSLKASESAKGNGVTDQILNSGVEKGQELVEYFD